MRGLVVWTTPEILTWQAWLSLRWRNAVLEGSEADGRQLLSQSQERAIWELALQQLAAPEGDPDALWPHAAALMRAASRAVQSLLPLRSASTDEERLLLFSLQRVRNICRERNLLSLNIALPDDLAFLAGGLAPLVVGEPQLSALQLQLQQRHWPASRLLHQAEGEATVPALWRTAHLDAEIAACAGWCREQLQQDGNRRLLVISAWQDPGASTQGAMLWRAMAGGGSAPDPQRMALLAVEGGEPLHQQALVDDAMAALASTGEWVDTRVLLQLLRSPYFRFGDAAECCALQEQLGGWALARWQFTALREALSSVSGTLRAADLFLQWLLNARSLLGEMPRRSATGWAECFSQCLAAAGFAKGVKLDSRETQRLGRWAELLDELASLDAALAPMTSSDARQALRRLARQAVHQAATGDAAITFTTQMHDPVVRYDGIWVMGLTENRWPAPPRPDPYVPLHDQRRSDWPESGVAQRLRSARWLQRRWQLRTDHLVFSFARQEGDVRHRASALLSEYGTRWRDADVPESGERSQLAVASHDRSLPQVLATELLHPLTGGVDRLRLQQECAFRSQAQWRLAARPLNVLTDGIPAKLRGMLLHSLLEGLWSELKDQQHLLQLTPAAQSDLVERQWAAAVQSNLAAGAGWLSHGVLQRERRRALQVTERVLEMERLRAPFVVRLREHGAVWQALDASMRMRIDRVDQTDAGDLLLVDYKSGAADSIRLHEGEARPLQLAVYVLALAQQGIAADGALLLSLKPAQAGFSGVATAEAAPLPRVKTVDDWPAAQQRWQLELETLLAQHLDGSAQLAQSLDACRYCHLPAFCRRRAIGDATPEEEVGDE